jgi:glucose/arabinose dehydrogenase
VVGYGVNYGSGSTIHEGTMKDDMEGPKDFWIPSIATSGLMFYTGDKFPGWRGSIFAGGMAGQVIARLTMDGDRVTNEEMLMQRMGRIRDVRQGPDGYIYVAIEDRRGAPTAVVRLEPAGAR